MRKIEVVDKFIHNGEVFNAEEVRQVNDAAAEYFVGHGWAKYADRPEDNDNVFNTLADGPVTDLDVHNVTQESQ